MQAAETDSTQRRDRFPRQIPFIIGNEACERFSFYGMVGILTLYIKNHLGKGGNFGAEVSHYFKFGVYFMPLFGAWLSDHVLGRYRTILYISFLYCAGHSVLALSDLTGSVDVKLWLLYLGLFLLSIGGGGIKPCVAAFVGDQFRPDQGHLLQKAFGLFYWSINFGSFFSFLLIPRVAKDHGYGWAFGIPGIAMGLATLIFWMGNRYYRHVPPAANSGGSYWGMLWYAVRKQGERQKGEGFWDVCRNNGATADQIDGARSATKVLGVFALIPFFWALWDQNSTTWVIQGESMVPYQIPATVLELPLLGPTIRFIAGETIGAEQMQSMNAIQVLVLVPIFTYLIFPGLERMGIRVSTLRRISAGMLMTAFSFVMIALIQRHLDAGEKLNVLWQTWPYLVLTAAEVLVSNTALEFAFREAPVSMRSTLMSFWYLTIAVGNLGVAQVFRLNVKSTLPDGKEVLYVSGVNQFWMFAVAMFVVSIAFVLVARCYQYREETVSKSAESH
ncbi:MAG TPA: MFS transporter [Candidatus Limnocylindria bacterium]|nr:MFS transporter [Candidatus Limnocylindria bacterium]